MYNYILSISSVLLGALLVLLFKPNDQKKLSLLLSFSGAFLLAVTVFDLLPEIFEENHHSKKTGVWIMVGILLQKVLEYFSQGAEHGHVHINKKTKNLPVLLITSLTIHALLEGFPMHHNDRMLIGIIIHKIPIAMILTTFLLQTAIKKVTIFSFLLCFSLITPLGAFISESFTAVQYFYKETTALVIGIFLHVSTTILFESNEGHKFNITKLVIILLATIIAYLI
ncbi:ZIP family metal transporter [Aquimarina hainanensis]|uniref:ZIP family metal transporter n=1 Tax=Aquimarina hainanensis TaxID=1578017 RepID=A0ABW5NGH9_9FLAO